jgi:hypothetical protein
MQVIQAAAARQTSAMASAATPVQVAPQAGEGTDSARSLAAKWICVL